ncbi:MAG: hypothetical protein ACTSXZ_07205 [Alphaproteobacteria bacterium]
MTARLFRIGILLLASGGLAGCEGAMVTVFAVQNMVKGVLGVAEPGRGYFGRQAGASVGDTDSYEIADRSARMLETGMAGHPMHWTIAETGTRASIEVDETTHVRRRVVNVREKGVEKAPLAEIIGQPYQPNFPIDLHAGPGNSYPVRRRLRRVDTFVAIARVAGSKWIMAGHQGRAIGYVYGPLTRPARDIKTVVVLREPPAAPNHTLPPQLSPAQAKVLRPPPPPRPVVAKRPARRTGQAPARALPPQTTPTTGELGDSDPGEAKPVSEKPEAKAPPPPPPPPLPFAAEAAAVAAAQAGPEATVEIVIAETPCRTVNYKVRPRASYTVERAFRACKAGDGAWEIVAPLLPIPPSVVSTVTNLADTVDSIVPIKPASPAAAETPAAPAAMESAPANSAPTQRAPPKFLTQESAVQESAAQKSAAQKSMTAESAAEQSTPAQPAKSTVPMHLEMRPVAPYAMPAE